MAIDLMRTNEVRSDLAEAADAGLLVAARAKLRDDSLTEADLTAIARKHFNANQGVEAGVEIETFDDCATSSDAYFNADNAAALAKAFSEIGCNLQELALTK